MKDSKAKKEKEKAEELIKKGTEAIKDQAGKLLKGRGAIPGENIKLS